MAKKTLSFKVNLEKKEIILYSNIQSSEAEKTLIEYYLNRDFTPKIKEKKKGETVEEMRKALKKDKEALEKFNNIYSKKENYTYTKKGKEESKEGYFGACAFYQEWKKNNK